jgi:cytochrome c553
MKKIYLSILSIGTICFLNSCYYDNFKELNPQGAFNACDTSNTYTYQNDIKSIIDANCVSCHSTGGTQPYLDTYQNIAAYSSEQLLGVLAPSAAKPMPPSSPLSSSDVDKIKQWVNGCRPYGIFVSSVCDTSAAMSYSNDIVPILSANCTNGCHDDIGLGHSLLTVADVQNDSFIVFSNVSYLVYSLVDTVPTRRMPLGRPRLSDCQVAKIRRWVTEGAQDN